MNMQTRRLFNVVNEIDNAKVGIVNKVTFMDNGSSYFDLNTRSVGIGFNTFVELKKYLDKYDYKIC